MIAAAQLVVAVQPAVQLAQATNIYLDLVVSLVTALALLAQEVLQPAPHAQDLDICWVQHV